MCEDEVFTEWTLNRKQDIGLENREYWNRYYFYCYSIWI